tara:strand:+ start:5116 stop:5844 length:729 start_codon:yes stop_codon:yes gene_type:complete
VNAVEIIPAIDIRGGKCVRLYQGDYDKETVYFGSPKNVATQWERMGATRLHIVDLDGARVGSPVNLDTVSEILSSVNIPVQLGGGIRTIRAVKSVVSIGVSRVIIGTAILENTDLMSDVISTMGVESVVAGIDVRDGVVLKRGWLTHTSESLHSAVQMVEDIGFKRFVYTDVSRDGTLTEPNFPVIRGLISSTSLGVIVAGGVSSLDHITELSSIGVEGVIVGKAIYSGDIDLSDAINRFKN